MNVPTLGLLALIRPFTITAFNSTAISAAFLVVSVIVFGILMWSKNMLTRREGVILFVIYIAYAANSLSAFVS